MSWLHGAGVTLYLQRHGFFSSENQSCKAWIGGQHICGTAVWPNVFVGVVAIRGFLHQLHRIM